MKAPVTNKTFTLTTEFDSWDGRIMVSETTNEPALQVQMDLERGQTTEVDIEILVSSAVSRRPVHLSIALQNGFWIDLYPFLGITSGPGFDSTWYPPYGTLSIISAIS